MRRDHLDAAAAFDVYLDGERGRAERFAGRLTPAGRRIYLDSFDDPEHQLVLFERWLSGVGKSFALGLTVAVGPADPQPVGCGGPVDDELPADIRAARSGTHR
jgi:hypothetical protein